MNYTYFYTCILHTRFQRQLFGIHGSLMNYMYFYTCAYYIPDFKDDCLECMVRYWITRISTLWQTTYQISKTTVWNSWFAIELHVFLHFGTLHTRFQRRLFGIHGSLMNYTYFYTLAHSSPGFKDDCSEFMVRYCSTRISTLWHTPYQISKMTVRNSWFASAVQYFYTLAQSLPALSRSKESVLSITTINL